MTEERHPRTEGFAVDHDAIVTLLALAEKATPGPWRVGPEARHGAAYPVRSPEHGLITQSGPFHGAENAAYIAAASPDVVAALCRDNIALREAVSFFASVIKSGERWSPTCEDTLRSLGFRSAASAETKERA